MNKKRFSINYVCDNYPIDESGKRILISLNLNYPLKNIYLFLWDRNKVGLPKEEKITNIIVWRIPCKYTAVGYGGFKKINLINYFKEKKHFLNTISKLIKQFDFNILILAEWKTLSLLNFIEHKNFKIIYLVEDMPANKIFKIYEILYLKKNKIDVIWTHSPYFNKFYKKYIKNIETIRVLPPKEMFNHAFDLKRSAIIKRFKSRPVKILFNGGIRYIDNLIALSSAVELFNGEVEFHLYGSGHEENNFKNYLRKKNIKFTKLHGRYEYRNTPKILSNHDFLSAIYPKNINTINALPNKLYESILFEKPILVTKGTKNCEIVEKFKIGECVDNPSDYKSIQKSIRKLLEKKDWGFKKAKKWIIPFEEELISVVNKTLPDLSKISNKHYNEEGDKK